MRIITSTDPQNAPTEEPARSPQTIIPTRPLQQAESLARAVDAEANEIGPVVLEPDPVSSVRIEEGFDVDEVMIAVLLPTAERVRLVGHRRRRIGFQFRDLMERPVRPFGNADAISRAVRQVIHPAPCQRDAVPLVVGRVESLDVGGRRTPGGRCGSDGKGKTEE